MINSEKKKILTESMLSVSGGACCISTAGVGVALGCGRTKAREYTAGLPKYAGKYLIAEVVEKVLAHAKY